MGIEEMVLDMAKKQGMELGEERGMERRNREVVINMLRNDFTDEMILKIVNVTPDYIQKIKASLN